MAKINRIRVVNLNYNIKDENKDNASISNRIIDETFSFDSDSTVMLLKNGGGKTVLIQMLIAQFVTPKLRSRPDRPFSGYFKDEKNPTYVLIEFILDNNELVTAAMGVKKCTGVEQTKGNDGLRIEGFIHEYSQKDDPNSIENINLIEYTENGYKITPIDDVERTIQNICKTNKYTAGYYNLSNSTSRNNYFDRLDTYGVNRGMFEHILIPINKQEGALPNLFEDCKDDSDLIEKWILDTIDKKLNSDNKILKQNINSIKEHAKFLRQREDILKIVDAEDEFKSYADKILEANDEHKNKLENLELLKEEFKKVLAFNKVKVRDLDKKYNNLKYKQSDIQKNKALNKYKLVSTNYYNTKDDLQDCENRLKEINKNKDVLEEQIKLLEKESIIQDILSIKEDIAHKEIKVNRLIAKRDARQKDNEVIQKELSAVIFNLLNIYNAEINEKEDKKNNIKNELNNLNLQRNNTAASLVNLRADEISINKQVKDNSIELKGLNTKLEAYRSKYIETLVVTDGEIKSIKEQEIDKKERLLYAININEVEIENLKNTSSDYQDKIKSLKSEKILLEREQSSLKEHKALIEEKTAKLIQILSDYELDESFLFDKTETLKVLNNNIKTINNKINEDIITRSKKITERDMIKEGITISLQDDVKQFLDKLEIDYMLGTEYLNKLNLDIEEKKDIIYNKNPMLPFSIVMDSASIKILKDSVLDVSSSFSMFIVNSDDLELSRNFIINNGILSVDSINMLTNFNEALIDENVKMRMISKISNEIKSLTLIIDNHNGVKRRIENDIFYINSCDIDKNSLDIVCDKIREKSNKISIIDNTVNQLTAKISDIFSKEIPSLEVAIKDTTDSLKLIESNILELDDFAKCFSSIRIKEELINNLSIKASSYKESISKNEAEIEEINRNVSLSEEKLHDVEAKLRELEAYKNKILSNNFKIEDNNPILEWSKDRLVNEYEALSQKSTEDIESLQEAIQEFNRDINTLTLNMNNIMQKNDIPNEECENKEHIAGHKDYLLKEIKVKDNEKMSLIKELGGIENKEVNLRRKLNKVFSICTNESNNTKKVFKANEDFIELPKGPIAEEDLEDIDYQEKICNLEREDIEVKNKIEDTSNQVKTIKHCNEKISLLDSTKDLINIVTVYDKLDPNITIDNVSHITDDLISKINKVNSDISNIRERISNICSRLSHDFTQKDIQQFADNIKMIDENKYDTSFIQKTISNVLYFIEEMKKKNADDLKHINEQKEEFIINLLKYIENVNTDLAKIDSKSAINLDGSTKKMLSITPPDWDEDKYKLRVEEFIEYILKKIKKNYELEKESTDSSEDILSREFKTSNLYNEVIGIRNVTMKLRKLESFDGKIITSKITWAKARANSGGEGFATAFIILVCLLSYANNEDGLGRKKESSKFLIMDNPFGKMSSAHLVAPFIEIAKKYNTQLICFTGIKESEVLNEFDNIYHLRLDRVPGTKINVLSSTNNKKSDSIEVNSVQMKLDTLI